MTGLEYAVLARHRPMQHPRDKPRGIHSGLQNTVTDLVERLNLKTL